MIRTLYHVRDDRTNGSVVFDAERAERAERLSRAGYEVTATTLQL